MNFSWGVNFTTAIHLIFKSDVEIKERGKGTFSDANQKLQGRVMFLQTLAM